ncbi:MAG: glutamine amidotransferase [Caldisericaceae bacterium]|nr:glutamine amidotransferase [Caldisericaceae bacterium]
MKKILILKAGSSFPELKTQKGDFEDWIVAASGKSSKHFQVLPIDQLNSLTLDYKSFAAVLITGSHDNITDNPPYLQKTYPFLKNLREQQTPVLGICFGHQLLAAAFGGKVTNLKNGPEFGAVRIKKTPRAQNDRLFVFLPQEFWAFMSHQQTVQKLPPKAIKLASSPKDQHAAFYLEPNIWGVQFHPEFDQQIMAFYLKNHFEIGDKEAKNLLLPCPQASAVIPQFLEKVL